ncbi:MAG: aldehyde dehydrogenase family protein, partial [Acidimicrobiales bacterium]
MTSSAMAPGRVDIEGVSVATGHLIGGERVGSASSFDTRSPLDWDRVLAEVARGDEATAEAAVEAAVEGFGTWSSMTPGERGALLHRLADLIEEHNDDIALVETLDMGFLLESMRLRLVPRGAVNFRTYADIYGYVKANEVIAHTGNLVLQECRDAASPPPFVGHVGGDD